MPLMQAEQAIDIDLPLKMLVWQDASGRNLAVTRLGSRSGTDSTAQAKPRRKPWRRR
jgi:uncharacterized protein (DUF302 family)